jgi:hypothetical protein
MPRDEDIESQTGQAAESIRTVAKHDSERLPVQLRGRRRSVAGSGPRIIKPNDHDIRPGLWKACRLVYQDAHASARERLGDRMVMSPEIMVAQDRQLGWADYRCHEFLKQREALRLSIEKHVVAAEQQHIGLRRVNGCEASSQQRLRRCGTHM